MIRYCRRDIFSLLILYITEGPLFLDTSREKVFHVWKSPTSNCQIANTIQLFISTDDWCRWEVGCLSVMHFSCSDMSLSLLFAAVLLFPDAVCRDHPHHLGGDVAGVAMATAHHSAAALQGGARADFKQRRGRRRLKRQGLFLFLNINCALTLIL